MVTYSRFDLVKIFHVFIPNSIVLVGSIELLAEARLYLFPFKKDFFNLATWFSGGHLLCLFLFFFFNKIYLLSFWLMIL